MVVRGTGSGRIVPRRRAADGSRVLALPKGHLDRGETAAEAAAREVREERRRRPRSCIEDLGEIRYWYRRDGQSMPKSVRFFLFRYLSGDVADHDHEVEEARWIPLDPGRRGAHATRANARWFTRALAFVRDR